MTTETLPDAIDQAIEEYRHARTFRERVATRAALRTAIREAREPLETALQRIRILATNGNPMDPEKAARCMDEIDQLAKCALSARSPDSAPPSPGGEARHWCLATKAGRIGRLEDCRECDAVAEHIAKELEACPAAPPTTPRLCDDCGAVVMGPVPSRLGGGVYECPACKRRQTDLGAALGDGRPEILRSLPPEGLAKVEPLSEEQIREALRAGAEHRWRAMNHGTPAAAPPTTPAPACPICGEDEELGHVAIDAPEPGIACIKGQGWRPSPTAAPPTTPAPTDSSNEEGA